MNEDLIKQIKNGALIKLRDGRKWKLSHVGENSIWGYSEDSDSPSSWTTDGKWRRDGIEGCADLVIKQRVLVFE